jgi:RNA polymerase sigma-70 factor (ECF subfamily)
VGRTSTCPGTFADDLDGYRQPLLRYALQVVNGDRQSAEDVVQETMLRAWQHCGVLSPSQCLPWLYRVAHNIAVSAYHRRRRARPAEVPISDHVVSATDDDMNRVLMVREMTQLLTGLSDDHRRVIVELFYLQRSVAETARSLDVPEGTVRSRCFYALRALRAALEKKGVTRHDL